jgi:hypothetical protein
MVRKRTASGATDVSFDIIEETPEKSIPRVPTSRVVLFRKNDEAVRRPVQHDTDKQGEALLRQFCARVNWGISRIEEDYGRDFEIEVFREGKTTGILFSLQLKSSAAPAYSAKDEFGSVELEIANARYLAHELETPTIIIQADVTHNRLFWSAPQLDLALLDTLANKPSAQSCTVRVPVANELPLTKDRLLDTVTRLLDFLASRRFAQADPRAFVATTPSMAESAKLKQALRDQADTLEMMEAQAVTATGDFVAARRVIRAVIESPLSSVESKFFAVLIEEKNERLALREEDEYSSGHLDLVLSTAKKIRELTRKGPGALKYYALIAQVAAEFYTLTREDWGLYQNWKAHQTTGDLWWRAELRVRRAETSRRVLRKLEQFLRLVRLSERSTYQSALPLAFLRIVEGGATLINRLELEGLAESGASIRDVIFRVCKLAAAISAQFGMDSERAQAVMSAALLSRNRQAECVLWAESEVEQIADQDFRDGARAMIANQSATLGTEVVGDEPIPIPMEKQVYENMASALGINLADTDDLIAQMVKTGIEDLDPTRILRDCTHMLCTLGRQGHNFFHLMLGQQLQLPTMGPKAIHCELHQHTRVGMSFDETYERFRREYCNKCPDRTPRPTEWHYTHEWQHLEEERNKEFMDGPRSPTYDWKPIGPPPPIPMPGKTCAACGLEFTETAGPWWCGHCQTWFCTRTECADTHEKHPFVG